MIKRTALYAVILTAVTSARAATPKMNAFPEGERIIYGKVVEAFRRNKFADAVRQRDILARNYPASVHLDNAFYLSGVLAFQDGNYAEAVRNFGVVADRFPQSNKRSSALFAKAMTYEKLNLQPQATSVFTKVIAQYPGSPDATRARAQLAVAKMKR